MKYIEKYLKDIIKVKPLGKLTTEEDELDGISGEMVYIDGKCSNIFISHIDYANWLEKQDEQNPYSGVSFKYNGHTWGMCARDNGVEILMDSELKAFISLDKSFIYPVTPIPSFKAYDMTYNPVDKFEPKSHEGEQKSDSFCRENCKGFKETGKCFADGDCKAKREAEFTDKVEQHSINEIEIPFGAKDSELQEATYFIPKGFHAEIDDDKVVIKKGEKPIAWNEEDKKCIRLSTDIIDSALRAGFCVQLDRDRCVDWLKSLKQRIEG